MSSRFSNADNSSNNNQVLHSNGATYTIDRSGTVTVKSDVRPMTQKENPGRTPKKDASYQPNDESGHILARTEGGLNKGPNIKPQTHDLNQGAYKKAEEAEKGIVNSGGKVFTEKTAFVSNQQGKRPDAFMINDSITHRDGKTSHVNLSFSNLSNDQLAEMEKVSSQHMDAWDQSPNPGRTHMSSKEIEETDKSLPTIREEFSEAWYEATPPTKHATEEHGASGHSRSPEHSRGGHGR